MDRFLHALVVIFAQLISIGSFAVAPTNPPKATLPSGPVELRSGQKLLDKAGQGRIFVHLVPKEICKDGVADRLSFYPALTSASGDKPGAVLTKENCLDIEPKTLPNGSFIALENEPNVLVVNGKLFNLHSETVWPAVVVCSGGKDSGGRANVIAIRRETSSGRLKARLSMKGASGLEAMELPVSIATKERLTIYQTEISGAIPSLSLSLGNFSGLTGFATYDLLFPGPSRISRKEANLSLPHCYIP